MAPRNFQVCVRCHCTLSRRKVKEVEVRKGLDRLSSDGPHYVCIDKAKCDVQQKHRSDEIYRLQLADEYRRGDGRYGR